MATAFGDRIQELREEQEMTLEQLAADLPITASTLGQIERGDVEVPSSDVIEALAGALDVSIQSLIDRLPESEQDRPVLLELLDDDKTSRGRETKTFPFEVKVGDMDAGTFEGYASTFGNVDSGGDRVISGAFTGTLKDFGRKGQLPAMVWHHDWNEPIGEWLGMSQDSKGLPVSGQLWVSGNNLGKASIERSEQVRNLLTSNGPKGLSIGYEVEKSKFVNEGENGKDLVRNLEKITLFEVSPVLFGMNAEATVTAAKAASFSGALPERKRELEKILRDAGFSRRDSKRLIAGGWAALVGDDEAALKEALQDLSNTINGG